MSGSYQNPMETSIAFYEKSQEDFERLGLQIEQLKGKIKNLKYRLGVLSERDVKLGELIRKAEIEQENNRRVAKAYEESAARKERRESQHRKNRNLGIFASGAAWFTGLVLTSVSGTYTCILVYMFKGTHTN